MNPALEQLAQRTAGALFNGLYQGLILATVLWLGLRLCHRVNAATRHAVGFVALLLVALLPVLHFIWPAQSDRANSTIVNRSPDRKAGGDDADTALQEPSSPVVTDSGIVAGPRPPTEIEDRPLPAGVLPCPAQLAVEKRAAVPFPANHPEIAPLPVRVRVQPTKPDTIGPRSTPANLPDLVAPEARQAGAAAAAPWSILSSPFPVRAQTWKAVVPGMASLVAVLAIGLIAAIRLLRLAIQLIRLHRLKRQGAPAAGELANRFDNLCRESSLNRPARLLISDRIAAPMAVGYARPAVLLPAELIASADNRALESVLRHELAHVQRRDDWINLIQQFVHAGLYFHPAVWWLSRRLTIDREIACDDHALACLESRHDYALFLTEFAGRSRGHDWIAAPAAWRKRSHLKERINMILDTQRNTSLRLARTSAGLITIATLATATLALLAGPRLVFAESSDGLVATDPPRALAGTLHNSSAATVSWSDDRATSVSASTGPASIDLPGSSASRAVVHFSDGRTIVSTSPVEAGVSVNANVDLADTQPRLMVVKGAPPPEAPDDFTAPKDPKPTPEGLPKPPRGPAWTPAPPDHSRESLERRMDRLERMLEKLRAERREFHFEFSPDDQKAKELSGNVLKDQDGRLEALLNARRDMDLRHELPGKHPDWPMPEARQKAMEKAMTDAQQQMARAMKNVEEQTREVERQAQIQAKIAARRDFARSADADAQRKAIEAQKHAIENQIDEMNRQLERLDQQRDRLNDEMERLDEQADHENDNADQRNDQPAAEPSLPKLKEKR